MDRIVDLKYIFFGAGKMGKALAQFWLNCGCRPTYFIDNNCSLWGKNYRGIPIYSPTKICDEDSNYLVIVSCNKMDEICQQLESYGISTGVIVRADELWKVLPDIWSEGKEYVDLKMEKEKRQSTQRMLFDLQGGLALGGIEAWVFQISQTFREWGMGVEYLTLNTCKHLILEEKENSVELDITGNEGQKTEIELAAEEIMRKMPCYLISNFTRSIFWGMCYAKHLRPEKFKIIAVIHNDEDRYYCAYTKMEKYIDCCIVLSSKMENELLRRGFPSKKIRYMYWDIGCQNQFLHHYSQRHEKLHIGYAGRITVRQKRADFLWEIIKKLSAKGIQFVFEIAGKGDYIEKILSSADEKGIADKVHFAGFLIRSEIPFFWQRQDIMVSCSDWEGHSISQCEAMAAGAVPIITDVSGARDDVIDGENGYVVDVGATDQIVEKICFLDKHRELLPVMGKKAYETIKQRTDSVNLEEFWKSILI